MPKVGLLQTGGRVRVSGDDTTLDYLYNSLTAGSGIELLVQGEGADERVVINTNKANIGVNHNQDLVGVQGTGTDYYHLSGTQVTTLTSGGSNDASSLHIHDSRYYTETELTNNTTALYPVTLGVGTAAPSGKAHIKGSADDQQLIVQGHTAQTTSPIEVWDSSNNVMAAVSGTGDILAAQRKIQLGIVPAGISNDYGVSTTTDTDTLSLWSIKTSASGSVGIAAVADVNSTTINDYHKIFSGGWVSSSDIYTEVFNITPNSLTLSSASGSAELLGTLPNSGSVTAVTVGSEQVYSTAGAKLLDVVNGSPGTSKMSVDYRGDVVIGAGLYGQAISMKSLEEEVTVASGVGYTDSSIQIPQYASVFAVSSRVTADIPTASGITVGVAGATARYGTYTNSPPGSVPAGRSYPGTDTPWTFYSAATAVRITANQNPVTQTGKVRLTIHYLEVTPATS